MTEASRVQKMLNEQNAWIDRLKSQVMRLELEIVGYRVRNKQLEDALHTIYKCCDETGNCSVVRRIVRKALEGEDER